MLNQEINQKGIQIEHVMVLYFNYSPKIQKNIEEKKLKDQLVFENQAEVLQGKRIALLPVSEGGMNLKTTDINQPINIMGIKSLAKPKED
jgi:hypothetical protein